MDNAKKDPGLSRSLDAITVALNLTCEEEQQWYTSTKELQLASRQFCTACRAVATLHFRVDDDTPGRLLAPADASSST
ncbi:unnamed protein product, partial [Ectocarpus fasciculatus]